MSGCICACICHTACGQDIDYSFCLITFKLHMQVVDDERRNPLDFRSQGHSVTGRAVSLSATNVGSPFIGLWRTTIHNINQIMHKK